MNKDAKTEPDNQEETTAWHTLSVEAVLEKLSVDTGGLTKDAVETRREKYGTNTLPDAKTDTYFDIFIRQFKSPLIYLLLVAAVTVLAMGEYFDGGIIVFILLFNAVIGTVQAKKAQNTLQALRDFAKTYATTRRDGVEHILEDWELVPGDIVILGEGDKVPADARLISERNLHVKEAALTGESEPISKEIEKIDNEAAPLGDRKNILYRGTNVVSGKGVAVVTMTGPLTEIGKISTEVVDIEMKIPLKENIRRLSHVIAGVVVSLAALIVVFGLLADLPFEHIFGIGVSVIVSAIPEGLPVVITLVLATGVWRLGKSNVLIKQLQAVEALGEADVVAVDKTGTITRNTLVVEQLVVGGQSYTVENNGYVPEGVITIDGTEVANPLADEQLGRAGLVGMLAADAVISYDKDEDEWVVRGDPTEGAMKVFGEKVGVDDKDALLQQYPLIDEIPFTSEAKYSAMLHQMDDSTKELLVVGAPEIVLERCNHQKINGETVPLDEINTRRTVLEKVRELSGRGYRVLMFASRKMETDLIEDTDITDCVFEGLYAMRDGLRDGIPEAVAQIKQAGLRMVMITGDHRVTARAIAEEAGIYEPGDVVVEGTDIDAMDNEELSRRVEHISVFARVSPHHKLRIIDAFQSRDETIAMTGDGVNDALSLAAANLGISMGKRGTDVAKESADLVLMDDHISSIVAALEEGRGIHQNIKKVMLFLFSTSFGEIMIIITAILAGLPLPITAAQIIWLNFVTDGFLDAALAMEPKEKGLLGKWFPKPSKWVVEKYMLQRMFLKGGTMTVGTIAVFVYTLSHAPLEYAITVAVTTMAAFQWTKIWTCRSDYHSVFSESMGNNKYLLWAFLLVVGLHLSALYIPAMSGLLEFVPIALFDWLIIIPTALSVIAVDELWKFVRRGREKRPVME
ncbi:MAG: HAD-IC family P-type ATPase [Candidatus Paceibacterota bacterium]